MSQQQIETVRVQREKHPDNPTGVVIINKSDLAEGDVLVKDDAEPEQAAPPAVTTQAEQPKAETPSQPWVRK